MAIKVYTDGAARGNPGIGASGFSIYSGTRRIAEKEEYNGVCTNNFAEYKAIILALSWIASNIQDSRKLEIDIYSDSELVVRQLTGKYKIKSPRMKNLNSDTVALAKNFLRVNFHNLPRGHPGIKMVDKRLNELLDRMEKRTN